MQQSREEYVIILTECIREYYGDNVIIYSQINDEHSMDFQLVCALYRSFLVRFCVGDIRRGGVFGINVSLGEHYIGLINLLPTAEKGKLSLNFDKDSINKNLNLLDEYLSWRMTDAQKETFNI